MYFLSHNDFEGVFFLTGLGSTLASKLDDLAFLSFLLNFVFVKSMKKHEK